MNWRNEIPKKCKKKRILLSRSTCLQKIHIDVHAYAISVDYYSMQQFPIP